MTAADTSPQGSFKLWCAENAAPVLTRIAIAGDFLPAGNLAYAANSSWRDMADPLQPHFADVAATFANLECPIDVGGLRKGALNGIGQIVRAEPETIDYLLAARCHVASLANNHAYDFGLAGIERTREALLEKGITPLGAGRTLNELPEIAIWRGPGNLRIGFWAAARAAREIATRKKQGVEPATAARAAEALDAMKRAGACFCVALIHSGVIRTNRPAPEDVTLFREIARAGFHVVAASHSHRISGGEMIKRSNGGPSFCFHGLGSVVSGYISAPLEREGLIAVAAFDALGSPVEIEIRPVYLPESGIGEVPSRDIARTILRRFEALSAEIADGSNDRLFYEDVSHGLVNLYLRDARAAFRQSGVRGLARKAARLRLRHVKRLMHRVFAT